MGKLNKLKHFFFRFLIYFVVLLWPYTKLQNLYQNVEGFKNAIFRNLAFYKFQFDPKANNDSILIFFFFYTLLECIFSILGLFNYFIGHLFSMIFFVITNFIYFNPFMPENKLTLVDPKIELFYNIGIFFSLGILAFYPKEEEEEKKEKDIEKEKAEHAKILEDEDMKRTMPVKKSKKNS